MRHPPFVELLGRMQRAAEKDQAGTRFPLRGHMLDLAGFLLDESLGIGSEKRFLDGFTLRAACCPWLIEVAPRRSTLLFAGESPAGRLVLDHHVSLDIRRMFLYLVQVPHV